MSSSHISIDTACGIELFFSFETGFLCSFGASPGTCFVGEAVLELRDPPASAPLVLRLLVFVQMIRGRLREVLSPGYSNTGSYTLGNPLLLNQSPVLSFKKTSGKKEGH